MNIVNVYEPIGRSTLSYPIWNSFYLQCKNIIAIKDKLLRNGFRYVQDIHDIDGNIYSVQAFNLKYGVKLNFLDYMSLVTSIPQHWREKNVYKTEIQKCMVCKSLCFIRDNYKTNKAVYEELNCKK